MNFSKEQLQTLNKLVQALPFAQRLTYLQDLGEVWDYLWESDDFLVDERDYNIYSIVHVGRQSWLGENLRYKGVPHWENPDNPHLLYGCLYDWTTLMDLDESYISKPWGPLEREHQGIAPQGWHIPREKEWEKLETALGSVEQMMGYVMKSVYGWAEDGGGSNASGLGVLPTGDCYLGEFYDLGDYASFWFASEVGAERARYVNLYFMDDKVSKGESKKGYAHSCRCVKNRPSTSLSEPIL